MKIDPQPPFEKYRVYKSFRQKEGRFYVTLVPSDGAHRIMSFARYVLSVRLGRELTADEEADHEDGNKLNDAADNLQPLTRLLNQRKSVLERGVSAEMVTLECPECGQPFQAEARNMRSRRKSGHNLFCSRSCSGKHSIKKRAFRPLRV